MSRWQRARSSLRTHDHRSRLESDRKQHRFLPIDCFPDECEVVIRLDDLAQELSNVGMIIDEKDFNHGPVALARCDSLPSCLGMQAFRGVAMVNLFQGVRKRLQRITMNAVPTCAFYLGLAQVQRSKDHT